ncbi:MAG TPA: hypothetical protein VGO43_00560 [Pyrinomonadaceae bacterium]|jgi:hypothetical protein|nr:hypothetical protein [Pyrinomonadaceae bacterium]
MAKRPRLLLFPTVSIVGAALLPVFAFSLMFWDATHEPLYNGVDRLTLAGKVVSALAVHLTIYVAIGAVMITAGYALFHGKLWGKWLLFSMNLGLSLWLIYGIWTLWRALLFRPAIRTEDVIVLLLIVFNLSSAGVLIFSAKIRGYLRPDESKIDAPPPPPDFSS